MGLQRLYLESGGFSSYMYYQHGETLTASNGVQAKVIKKVDGNGINGLPIMSKTGEMYLKANKSGEIIQARIYKNREPHFDLDWGHPHTNLDGEKFPRDVVHVQSFYKGEDGGFVRNSKYARYMTPEEISRYGEILRRINPNIKFRP